MPRSGDSLDERVREPARRDERGASRPTPPLARSDVADRPSPGTGARDGTDGPPVDGSPGTGLDPASQAPRTGWTTTHEGLGSLLRERSARAEITDEGFERRASRLSGDGGGSSTAR